MRRTDQFQMSDCKSSKRPKHMNTKTEESTKALRNDTKKNKIYHSNYKDLEII